MIEGLKPLRGKQEYRQIALRVRPEEFDRLLQLSQRRPDKPSVGKVALEVFRRGLKDLDRFS